MTFTVGQRVRILKPNFNARIWGLIGTVTGELGSDPGNPRSYPVELGYQVPGVSRNATSVLIEPDELEPASPTTHSLWSNR